MGSLLFSVSVSIVSGYGLEDRAIEVRSPAQADDFSSSLCPDRFWALPASCTTGTGGRKSCMKMTVFWDVAPCSLVETDRRFRDSYGHHHQGAVSTSETSVISYKTIRRNIPRDIQSGSHGCSKHFRNVGNILQDYTAQHPMRHSSSYSSLREPVM
jgi:hypothetical protein